MTENMKRILTVAALCIAIAALVYGGISYVINRQEQQRAVTRAVCLAANKNANTLKNLLSFFEGKTLQSPQLTPKERLETIRFYQQADKQLPEPARC